MLVRLASGDLVEYPDEVGALALADPSHGDVLDISLVELNIFLNGLLAIFYDEELTLEENIEWAREHYTRWGSPTECNMKKAISQIKLYNENIPPSEVGYGPLELVKELYGIQSSKPKEEVYIIENMPSPPRKLLNCNDDLQKANQKATQQPADEEK